MELSHDLLSWIWLVGGVILLLAELVLPGLVAGFLGAAAVLVAGLRFLGVIEGLAASVAAWMGLSVVLTLSLRRWMQRLLPGDVKKSLPLEDTHAFGTLVEVLETIREGDADGRIRWQGTTWPAMSTSGVIPKGARAHLVVRQDLAWLVEPVPALESETETTLDALAQRAASRRREGE